MDTPALRSQAKGLHALGDEACLHIFGIGVKGAPLGYSFIHLLLYDLQLLYLLQKTGAQISTISSERRKENSMTDINERWLDLTLGPTSNEG
ncbi:hypothetical protein V6N12_059299 [Hibiscus sabdariffa]|uniref:Uncharacterized protein n=1 Tax=Hibiscus sabdariffa TaxID=183260 RepID=A0ABR2EVA2_9ROSI